MDRIQLFRITQSLLHHTILLGTNILLTCQHYFPQALKISNRPVFYHPQTPERPGHHPRRSTGEEGRSSGDYDDGYGQYGEDSQGDGGADIESRYHQIYEQRMNPFDQV